MVSYDFFIKDLFHLLLSNFYFDEIYVYQKFNKSKIQITPTSYITKKKLISKNNTYFTKNTYQNRTKQIKNFSAKIKIKNLKNGVQNLTIYQKYNAE